VILNSPCSSSVSCPTLSPIEPERPNPDDLAGPTLIDPEELDAVDAAREGMEAGEQLGQAAQMLSPLNSRGEPYPTVIDPRTGEPIPFPDNPQLTPQEERVTWDSSTDRAEFIREWHDRGYEEPPGGWSEYDVHHILPREYGGTNDFDNLVPVERETHQQELNRWWSGFEDDHEN
jgi:hypothetical protein